MVFISPEFLAPLKTSIGYGLFSCIVAFLWAPFLIKILYKFNITRRGEYDSTLSMENRRSKAGVPIMGGLLIILTVAVLTFLFNWERKYTYVPVGVMLLSALLGGIDDILHIYGHERRNRKLSQVFTLIKVHKDWKMRVWYIITLPWSLYKRLAVWLSRHPGKGVHVHEKLLLQFLAGAITAWWIYFKLGENWRDIYLPFDGFINIGWWIMPVIILFVMFTANAVNVADGMDGLAGGSLLFAFASYGVISFAQGKYDLATFCGVIVGALLAFLWFNINPARFIMGDTGSISLGVTLALVSLYTNTSLILPLLGIIFVVEALSTILQIMSKKLRGGKKIFRSAPIHHHFEAIGWPEPKIVMRFWVIAGVGAVIGLIVFLLDKTI